MYGKLCECPSCRKRTEDEFFGIIAYSFDPAIWDRMRLEAERDSIPGYRSLYARVKDYTHDKEWPDNCEWNEYGESPYDIPFEGYPDSTPYQPSYDDEPDFYGDCDHCGQHNCLYPGTVSAPCWCCEKPFYRKYSKPYNRENDWGDWEWQEDAEY